jgi:hypothetical protein
MMKLVVLAMVLSACGPAKFALLPRGHYNSRDPDLTRPLVPTPGTEPRPEAGAAPSRGTPGEIMVGPVSASVTGAAVLGWLLGGAAPLIGLYGEFDENHLVDPNAPQPPTVRTEQ